MAPDERADPSAAPTAPSSPDAPGSGRRTAFHPLDVVAVDQLTDDAVAVTVAVPGPLRAAFAFQAGQHVTVRHEIGGTEVRRSYSICSTPSALRDSGLLRIGVRRLTGGAFSGYAMTLRTGDQVRVLPPIGHFTSAFAPERSRHYAAVAAGSGITPVLSLAATALEVESASRVTIVYANRTATSVMFTEELADLKDRYPTRLQLIHVMSREPRESALLSGRLDGPRLTAVLAALVPPETVDEWFLCGPYALVIAAQAVLAEHGVAAGAVHTELFHVEDEPADRLPGSAAVPDAVGAELTFALDGRVSTVTMRTAERVLDAALRVRPELPFACKGGVCSTCRARLTLGEVAMVRNYALEPDEVAAGYVLTCQAVPRTERLRVDYDG